MTGNNYGLKIAGGCHTWWWRGGGWLRRWLWHYEYYDEVSVHYVTKNHHFLKAFCLFVTFYFHFHEGWVCLFVRHILSLLSWVVRPLWLSVRSVKQDVGKKPKGSTQTVLRAKCIQIYPSKCIHPNVSTQTELRPSHDNDDDDRNDDRVGAVVEQFGRTEEQIYWLISALLPVHLELHILSKTKTKIKTETETKTEKPMKWSISVLGDPKIQIDL